MANEKELDTELDKTGEGAEEVDKTDDDTESEESEEGPEAKAKEPPKESDEARKARLERQLKQVNKKLGVDTEKKPKIENKKSDEFDDGQLAYLVAKWIESDEDVDFTRDELKKHGGNLRELLGNEYFKAKMVARKDAKIALEATPTSTRRTSSKAGDAVEVEYSKYLKTGKLPEDREMRKKIVNMRLEKEKTDDEFGG